MGLFKKRQYITIPTTKDIQDRQANIPNDLWQKCPKCQKIIYLPDITNYKCCPNCQHHYRLTAQERLTLTVDKQSFQKWQCQTMVVTNPLQFPEYAEKIAQYQHKTALDEAIVIGQATINNHKMAIGVMDTHFMMGSMGTVVGEKITHLFEKALDNQLPVILFCASGGARMQEGTLSLMQMAKISTAVENHSQQGLLYVSILTDPTTGGVTASFAMQADVIVAEPKATVGFAGKRVIEQTIKEILADDFQSAEQVQQNGFIDCIVQRDHLRAYLARLLTLHQKV